MNCAPLSYRFKREGECSPFALTGLDIRCLMRAHKATIAGLALAMDIPLTRVLHVREFGVTGIAFVLDWCEAITGDPYWFGAIAETDSAPARGGRA